MHFVKLTIAIHTRWLIYDTWFSVWS